MTCSTSSKIALVALLGVAVLFAVVAAWTMPRMRETFEAGESRVQVVHAKWCGHCTKLMQAGGEFSKLKASLPGVSIVAVDERSPEGKRAIEACGVKGFPDIRVMKGDKCGAPYGGERSAAAMKAWILKEI